MNFYKDTCPTVETNAGDKISMNDIAINSKAVPTLVDSGSKNLLDLESCIFDYSEGLSCEISNSNEISVSTTSSSESVRFILIENINLPVNTTLVLSGCPENGGGDSYLMDVTFGGLQVDGSVDTGTGSTGFILNSNQTAYIRIRIAANYTMSNKVFKVMVCKKDLYDISTKYVPYKNTTTSFTGMGLLSSGSYSFDNIIKKAADLIGRSETEPVCYQFALWTDVSTEHVLATGNMIYGASIHTEYLYGGPSGFGCAVDNQGTVSVSNATGTVVHISVTIF